MALDYKSGLSRYRKYLQVVREQPLIRAGIWTALSLILVIVMIVMALKPTLVVIAGLLGQIRQDREILTKLDDKILKIQQASATLDSISARLPILDEALPVEAKWNEWAEVITSVASESGVQLSGLNVGPAPISGKIESVVKNNTNQNPALTIKLPEGINGLDFSVNATGTFENLRKMIGAIENTRRLNVLSITQFTATKNKAGGTDLSVYIKGAVVYSP